VCRKPGERTRLPAKVALSYHCSPLSSGQGMLVTTKSTIGYIVVILAVDFDVLYYQSSSHCETDWAP